MCSLFQETNGLMMLYQLVKDGVFLSYNVEVIKEGQMMCGKMFIKTLLLLTSASNLLWNGRDKSSRPGEYRYCLF